MKIRALSIPAWLADEWSLLRYLMSPHDGHAYPEDLLDAISLITSWVLVGMAVLAVLAVVADGLIH
jgi:hypothetical protein